MILLFTHSIIQSIIRHYAQFRQVRLQRRSRTPDKDPSEVSRGILLTLPRDPNLRPAARPQVHRDLAEERVEQCLQEIIKQDKKQLLRGQSKLPHHAVLP